MGGGSSCISPEDYKSVRADLENEMRENRVLESAIKKLGLEKNDLVSQINKLSLEKNDLALEAKKFAMEKNDLVLEAKKIAMEKDSLQQEAMQQLKKIGGLETKVQRLTTATQDLKEELMQEEMINKGLTDVIQQLQQQRNTSELKEIIPQKTLWQQVKEINVYIKIAVVAIPVSLLALYAIRRYLTRRRQPSVKSDLLPEPWRKIHPTFTENSEIKDEFLKKILEIWPNHNTTLNILLLGEAGSGKSSFVNACLTALLQEERYIVKATAGAMSSDSTTLRLKPYALEIKIGVEKTHLPVKLYDCRGLFVGNRGVQTEDIRKICRGHIKDEYVINPNEGIKRYDKMYREDPKEQDKMHCIVYVLAADEDGFVREGVEEQLREIKDLFRDDTLQLILLTKVDRLGISDVTQIFRDRRVKERCEAAANFLEVCINDVFPQSNYSEEMVPCATKDTITLFNIKSIMERACDRMDKPGISS